MDKGAGLVIKVQNSSPVKVIGVVRKDIQPRALHISLLGEERERGYDTKVYM